MKSDEVNAERKKMFKCSGCGGPLHDTVVGGLKWRCTNPDCGVIFDKNPVPWRGPEYWDKGHQH